MTILPDLKRKKGARGQQLTTEFPPITNKEYDMINENAKIKKNIQEYIKSITENLAQRGEDAVAADEEREKSSSGGGVLADAAAIVSNSITDNPLTRLGAKAIQAFIDIPDEKQYNIDAKNPPRTRIGADTSMKRGKDEEEEEEEKEKKTPEVGFLGMKASDPESDPMLMPGKRTVGQNLAMTAAAGIVGLAAARDSPAATVAAAGVATLTADRMGVFGNNNKRMSAGAHAQRSDRKGIVSTTTTTTS